jgi:hypothetical protein
MKRWPILLSIVSVVIAVSVGSGWVSLGRSVAAPGWEEGAVDCRRDPLAHVHHPARFSIEAPCASISATVKRVELVEAFGNLKLSLRPDPSYAEFLRDANEGIVMATVIPPDQPFISIPALGEHATFYGAWVIDKARDAVELHPAWYIRRSDGRRSPSARPVLRVNVGIPPAISIGEPLPVWASVTKPSGGGKPPATVSEVRLFAELTSATEGVDWKAGLTNTRGIERLDFVALQIPGEYRITLYALKDGERGVARANIKVRRR